MRCMLNYKVKIGLVPMRRNTTNRPPKTFLTWVSAEERGHRFVKYIEDNFTSEHVEFVNVNGMGHNDLIFDDDSAAAVVEKFQTEKVDAVIIINGNTITIKSEIVLTGENATTDLAQLYLRDILDNWGKLDTYMHDMEIYNVVWDVNVRVAEPNETYVFNGVNNYMEVNNDEKTGVWGTNHGRIRSESNLGIPFEYDNPMSHEFGHILGLKDKYQKGGKNHNKPTSPYWTGNVMAEEAGVGLADKKNLDIILPKAIKYFQSVKGYADIAPWTQYYYINRLNRE